MSLRLKTLLIAILSLIGLAVGLGITATTVLNGSFRHLEEEDVREDATRVSNAFREELAHIEATASAWSLWDDALFFVQGKNPQFLKINDTDSALQPAAANVVVYLTPEGTIRYATGYDITKQRRVALPAAMRAYLNRRSPLLGHNSRASRISGILMLPQGPLLVVSCPVSTTGGNGPIGGALIMGRLLDEQKLKALSNTTHLPLSWQRFNAPQLPADFALARGHFRHSRQAFVLPQNERFVGGYLLMNDLNRKPALLLRFEARRLVYEQGQLGMRSIIWCLVAVTLLFSGLMMAFLEGMVLSRLAGLSTAVARIDSSQATFPQLPAGGNDELAELAHNINSLLAAIEHSHQELHASEERFRLIAQATNEAIYDWHIAEDRLWWGESFSKLFGHNIPSGHTDIQTWAGFLHPDDAQHTQDNLQTALKQPANFWSAEYRFRRADGTYADVLERGYFLRDDAGKAVRMLGAILDISERKQAALALQRAKDNLELQVQARTAELEQLNQQLQVELHERRQAQIAAQSARAEAEQANHAKSEFLARMSHELRTPLNAILGFGQLLEISDLKPRQQQSVQQILQGGRHLLALINEILDISRIESGNLALDLEAVIPDSVLTEAVELVMPLTAGNHIALEYSPSSCCQIPVLADKQRLKQVLINLLSNAIKYNRPNGKVKITCRITAEQRFQCQITDTGHGIAPDDLPRLFQPFERLNVARSNAEARSNVEGTGLGLAFSRRFLEAMSGTVSVESTLGAGSTFTIELALAEPTRATPSLLLPTTHNPSINAPQHH